MAMADPGDKQRRSRILITAVVLAVVAAVFYVAFIILSIQ